jgi:hypothetical protein
VCSHPGLLYGNKWHHHCPGTKARKPGSHAPSVWACPLPLLHISLSRCPVLSPSTCLLNPVSFLFHFQPNPSLPCLSVGALLLSVVWGPAPSALLRTSLEMQRPRLHPRPSSRESESAL